MTLRILRPDLYHIDIGRDQVTLIGSHIPHHLRGACGAGTALFHSADSATVLKDADLYGGIRRQGIADLRRADGLAWAAVQMSGDILERQCLAGSAAGFDGEVPYHRACA